MADYKENKNKKRKSTGRFISLILLIIASGVVFYFGWIQIDLPENTYAVLFSKTSGYHDKVLIPGEFSWRWERLLPTNSELIMIKTENKTVELEYSGLLPSGELYSSILPGNPDFSYNIKFSISYFLNHQELPSMVADRTFDTRNIENWYKSLDSKIITDVKKTSVDFFNENNPELSDNYLLFENKILEHLNKKYYFLTIQSFSIKYLDFPDLQLYSKSKELYFQILEKRKEIEIKSDRRAIESKIDLESKLEVLSQYGELLTKYPILIDYFSLNPESQTLDVSILDSIVPESSDN